MSSRTLKAKTETKRRKRKQEKTKDMELILTQIAMMKLLSKPRKEQPHPAMNLRKS